MNKPSNRGQKTLQWLGWADDDYIAARTLLLEDLLVQGGAFSTTALEKYLKALLILSDKRVPRIHDVSTLHGHLNSLGIHLPLNADYLRLLVKLYKLRYPDELKSGFNVAVNRTKLITELDKSVYEIRKGFRFSQGEQIIPTKLDHLKGRKDPHLLDDNVYFGSADRAALFKTPAFCYEMRVVGPDQIMQVTYKAERIEDDGKFDLEGLKTNEAKGR